MAAAVHDQLRAAEVFQKQYSTYQGLYEGDYIGHRAAYEALKPLLRGKGSSFFMLDLGCGDAWAICKTLTELGLGGGLHEYVGVDLSSPAIDLAKENLRRLNPACSCHWHVTDMLSYLQHSKQHTDLVIASFSMHHLAPEDKLAVLREGHRLLSPKNGIFCMVDVLRDTDESVQDYRDRICSFAAKEWVLVDPPGRQAMIDHMQAYDMPDALEDFAAMSQQAGFARMQHAFLSSNKYGNLIVFEC